MKDKILYCPFCNIDKTKLENTILEETKNFYIIPSLGALVEGYILIISKRHVNSMSELTNEEMEEYKMLIEKYRKIFKKIYKKYPIIFEHGTPNLDDIKRSSSVIHAHSHIVNHQYKNDKKLLLQLNFKEINDLNNINLKNNYIFYINPNGKKYITYQFDPISQFMRVEISKDLNLFNKYDWHKNSFDENIILTINDINEYLYNKNK